MKNLSKYFLITLIILLSIGCSKTQKIKDTIQPIKLTSGFQDSLVINDLFYSDNYDVRFKENDKINLEYNVESKKLYLKADSSFEGATILEFEADMRIYDILVISQKEELYEFNYKPNKKYEKINLFGSFNGWDRTNLPMKDKNNDGIFEATVKLDPGVYQYKFFADGEEIIDAENPEKISNGMGSYNSIRTINDPDTNKRFLHISKIKQEGSNVKISFFIENTSMQEIDINKVFALLNNSRISKNKVKVNKDTVEISLTNFELIGQNTLRVLFESNGKVSNLQTVNLFDGKPAGNKNFTWRDAIIYSVMIDRFSDGNLENNNPVLHDSLNQKANYMGGDFDGIITKLNEGYFENLGINVLWISPANDNPNTAFKEYPAPHRYYSGYHGYWPISSSRVEEHFGTLDQLKEIVSLSHKKGIKVLLDFVSNHVHIDHPYFKEHRNWFGQLELPDGRLNLRFWDEFRLTTWFEPYLPSFDYLGSPEALEEMTDNAVWWLNETGADGYRHDAVKHVPNEFWRKLNDKIKAQVEPKRKLPVYQIGETFGSYELISSYVNNGQLSSQFNFNLYDVAIPTFIRDESSFSGLDKEMNKTFSVYGVNHLMGNVMDSHDKNRFMAFADGDLDASEWSAPELGWANPPVVDSPESYKKLVLYMAFMNSIPGLPVIYYGSEFGMTGASDPDNRRMMRFGEQLADAEKNTLSEVSKIINLRKTHSALRNGDFYTLLANENVYCYIRSDFNERILVLLNKGDLMQNLSLRIPNNLSFNSAKDLSTNQEIQIISNSINVSIDSKSWMYIELN